MSQRDDDRTITIEAVEDLSGLRVPPETYHAVFVRDPQGRAVLEDLVGRFHDCELAPDPERTHDVAAAIGARKVLGFILRRISQIKLSDADTQKG